MPGAVFIEGENIELRTFEEDDIEFLRENYNSPAVRDNIISSNPQNLAEIREYFEEVSESEEVHLTIWAEDERIGRIYTFRFNKLHGRAVLGIWLKEEAQGNGYGTEAAGVFTDYLFDQMNVHKVIAKVFDFNYPSQKVWKRLGFEEEAVLKEEYYAKGEYRDLHYYGVTEDEWSSENI